MDILCSNQGSIWLLIPMTSVGKDWIEENVSDDAIWFGRSLVVEPRYVQDIIEGMIGDRLEVQSWASLSTK